MHLGQAVLSKIENLLIRCDKNQTKPRRQQQYQQQNLDYNAHIKLYHDFKIMQQKKQQIQDDKDRQEMKKLSPFKVTNKHTIFLNAQKQTPPIHLRLQEIQNKKLEQMIRLREKYPFRDENQQYMIQMLQELRKRERKFTQQEAQEKVEDLLEKERMRIERLNMLKIQVIDRHSKEYRCKPYVGKGSDQLWNRYKLKKQLSNSVFQRFEQYEMERKSHLERNQKRVKELVTPFAPKINENSRLIASRSLSRTNLQQSLSRSCSCKCFKRDNQRVLGNSTVHSSRKR